MISLPHHVSRAITSHFGVHILRIDAAQQGLTAAIRCVVTFSNGVRAFVKCSTDSETQTWLRSERVMYAHFSENDAVFAPQFLLWIEGDGAHAFDAMVLENLSACEVAPPWNHGKIESVLNTLEAVRKLTPPAGLSKFSDAQHFTHPWKRISNAPAVALAQGVIGHTWWAQHGEALAALDGARIFSGVSLLHLDVRSDNMRFRGDQCVLFDWNWACVGNPRAECAGWLASLAMEGGALPAARMEECRDEILLFMGFLLHGATEPIIPKAPTLREFQRKQALALLPFVDDILGANR